MSLRCLFLIASLGIMASCAAQERSDEAVAAKKQMIGLSREHVLACMGPPRKKMSEGATEVWSYTSTGGHGASNGNTIKFGNGVTSRHSNYDKASCVASVVMTNGVVSRVNYNGPSGDAFAPYEQCGYLVNNCLREEEND